MPIVYVNNFTLNPTNGIKGIVTEIAKWIGKRQKYYVDPCDIQQGIDILCLPGDAVVSSVSSSEGGDIALPFFLAVKFDHPDSDVVGRRWITEIGLRKVDSDEGVFFSILLRTEEISGLVTSPILVTCPKIVHNVISTCNPASDVISGPVINLHSDIAKLFLYDIEHVDRKYPFVFVSYNSDGGMAIDPEKLRRQIIGLAKIVVMPEIGDQNLIKRYLNNYYVSDGAISIIFPGVRLRGGGVHCRVVTLDNEHCDKSELIVFSDILSIITHRTNPINLDRHISPDTVHQQILQHKLRVALDNSRNNENISAYEQLLEEAEASISDKIRKINDKDNYIYALMERIESIEGEEEIVIRTKDAKIASLEDRISKIESNSTCDAVTVNDFRDITLFFEEFESKNLKLESILNVLCIIFRDRIIVLESAISAARISDKKGFRYCLEALDLLIKLCSGYWRSLSVGIGDQEARRVFGLNEFSAKEADTLSVAGRKRREFVYNGNIYFMEKHLKIGIKKSYAETLRIHFEWVADEKKVVIGYCGGHLDF